MAERKRQRTKIPARRASAADDLEASAASLEAMRRDRDAVRAELTAAKRRIAELERDQAKAADRIDWVIDSLNTLLEDDALVEAGERASRRG